MDLIFIDGGHSYPTVKSDWENSKSLMHNKTAVFFHNYNFSGVKQVVDNIPREQYQVEIIDPPSDYPTAHVKKKTRGNTTYAKHTPMNTRRKTVVFNIPRLIDSK
jgi:hypothetical protein